MNAERRRLALALLLSLLIHTLLLSLTFGGQGLGLPGFGFPWQERRAEVPELRIVIVPAQAAGTQPTGASVREPMPQASIEQPAADGPALTASVTPAPALGRTAEVIAAQVERAVQSQPTAEAGPEPDAATGAAPTKVPLRTEGPDEAAPSPVPVPAVLAMAQKSDEATWAVPAAPSAPASAIAAAPVASSPEAVMPATRDAVDVVEERTEPEVRDRAAEVAELDRLEREAQRQAEWLETARIEAARQEAARQEAERQEAVRQESVRQEAARQEAARQEAARREAERLEAVRQEAERLEAARQEAARQEVARQEAARQEAQRVEAARQEAVRQEAVRQDAVRREAERLEAARQEAARQEVARQEVARQEVARQEAARQEAQRVEAARQEAARQGAAQEADARREAARRAMGRQLDEEAAQRAAASAAADLPSRPAPASSGTRRARLFGRADPNAELVLYAEAWARKIQLNMTFDMVRDAAKRPHTDPLVTVAIRSDGSVESVTFVMSSGVAEIDEAIRRIVQSQLPYPAFPPALASEFDVVEIRRTWHFDMAIRLY